MDIAGKVYIVTGGASGLGLALATAFLERGDRVIIADLAPTDDRPDSVPADAHYLRLDVRSEDEWQAARADQGNGPGGRPRAISARAASWSGVTTALSAGLCRSMRASAASSARC